MSLGKAIIHVREFGFRHALYVGIRSMLLGISSFLEKRRDRKLNVRTAGIIPVEDLGITGENVDHSEDYVPTPASVLSQALSAVRGPFEDIVFIDIGSGKGRMLFRAAKYPFKKIIGLEHSKQLHKLCQENIANFTEPKQECVDIVSVHADALEYPLPNEDLFVFMFNPFSSELMGKFVERLEDHFNTFGNRIYIAYYNPKYGDILQKSDFLEDAPNDPPLLYCSVRPTWPLATFATRRV